MPEKSSLAVPRVKPERGYTCEQIADYEVSIQDRLGDAPPVPIVGYGTLEEEFRVIGQELGFGTITVDEAVDRFFTEMDVVLSNNA